MIDIEKTNAQPDTCKTSSSRFKNTNNIGYIVMISVIIILGCIAFQKLLNMAEHKYQEDEAQRQRDAERSCFSF